MKERTRALAIAVTLSFALAGALPAAGAPDGTAEPPPPPSHDHGDLLAWMGRFIDAGPFELAAETARSLLFYDPHSVEPTTDGATATIRGEYYDSAPMAGTPTRSFRDKWAFDCKALRVRTLERQTFPRSNLQGVAGAVDQSKGAWSEPHTVGEPEADLIDQVCSTAALLRTGVDPAKTMPSRLDDVTGNATRDWLDRYIDAKGYSRATAENGVGVYFSAEGAGRSVDGWPQVWIRAELVRPLPGPRTVWRSMRYRSEVDCGAMRHSDTARTIYPGSNLTGPGVPDTNDPDGWEEAVAGSLDGRWMTAVCRGIGEAGAPADHGPATRSQSDVEAWIAATVNTNGYVVVGGDADGVYLYGSSAMASRDDGVVSTILRYERFAAATEAGALVRSIAYDIDIDCKTSRTRVTGAAPHAGQNLEGAAARAGTAGPWKAPAAPDTLLGQVVQQACGQSELLAEGVDRQKAMPSPPRDTRNETLAAWVRDNLDPAGYSIGGFSDNAIVLFRPADHSGPPEESLSVWIRFEDLRPILTSRGVERSMRVLADLDCSRERARFRGVEQYPGANLSGTAVRYEDRKDWSPVAQDTLLGAVLSTACQWKDEADRGLKPSGVQPLSSMSRSLGRGS